MRQKKGGAKGGSEAVPTWSPVGDAGDAGVWELSLGSEHQAELAHQEDQPHGSERGPVRKQQEMDGLSLQLLNTFIIIIKTRNYKQAADKVIVRTYL